MTIIPNKATNIAKTVVIGILSFIDRNASNAVIKGIKLTVNKVLATVVLVIAKIYVIFVKPKIIPPATPCLPA